MPNNNAASRGYVRYSAVAIALHWLIAALILFQIGLGLWLAGALNADDETVRFAAFEQTQIHKSVGLTVLALTLVRLIWRWAHPTPPSPPGMNAFERFAAGAAHIGLYALMLLIPLAGWAMVSSSPQFNMVPTLYFGGAQIPHMPVLSTLNEDAATLWSDRFRISHRWLAYGAILLFLLHVAAALKHHFVDRDQVLARMAPGLRPRGPVSEAALAGSSIGRRLVGYLLIGAVAAGIVLMVMISRPGGDGAITPIGRAGVTEGGVTEGSVTADASIPRWRVVAAQSEIAFTGDNAGDPFTGTFSDWTADIAFDPARLSESRAVVRVRTASAATGDPFYDGSLTGGDWLNVQEHPEAVFEVVEFRALEDVGFVAVADLTVKGRRRSVEMPFSLVIEGERAEMQGELPLQRLDFDIGAKSDAVGKWVSLELLFKIRVVANRLDAG